MKEAGDGTREKWNMLEILSESWINENQNKWEMEWDKNGKRDK